MVFGNLNLLPFLHCKCFSFSDLRIQYVQRIFLIQLFFETIIRLFSLWSTFVHKQYCKNRQQIQAALLPTSTVSDSSFASGKSMMLQVYHFDPDGKLCRTEKHLKHLILTISYLKSYAAHTYHILLQELRHGELWKITHRARTACTKLFDLFRYVIHWNMCQDSRMVGYNLAGRNHR